MTREDRYGKEDQTPLETLSGEVCQAAFSDALLNINRHQPKVNNPSREVVATEQIRTDRAIVPRYNDTYLMTTHRFQN